MTLAMLLVAVIFAIAVVLFVTERLPIDVTALLTAAALMLTGVLDPAQGLSGFANPATITIASMIVLSVGLEQSGALRVVVVTIERLTLAHRWLGLITLYTAIGVLSGFVNNTAIVAIFMPILIDLGPRLSLSPSKLLMPLSFAALLGGICTLVGTSTNLMLSTIAAEHGLAPIGMFELLPVGGVLFVAGLAYLLVVGLRIIPARRRSTELTESFELQPWLTDLTLGPDSQRVGVSAMRGERLQDGLEVDVIEVLRQGRPLAAGQLMRPGDVLRVRGSAAHLADLTRHDDLRIGAGLTLRDADLAAHGTGHLVEVVLPSRSIFVGSRLGTLDFARRFGALVLAVRQRGELRREALDDCILHGGDALLLRVDEAHLAALRRQRSLVVASLVATSSTRRALAPLAVAIMLAVILSVSLELVPTVVAATTGVMLMVLTGCLRMDQVYTAIPWRIVMLLAGVIPLGLALEETGLAGALVAGFVGSLHGADPHLVVGGVFLLTLAVTSVLSNVATATLLAPIVLQLASTLGIDGRGLLLTVTFGASMSFLSPIGYQANMLIYGPGQYRFADFLRVGAPLSLLCGAIVTWLVPIVWPLAPLP